MMTLMAACAQPSPGSSNDDNGAGASTTTTTTTTQSADAGTTTDVATDTGTTGTTADAGNTGDLISEDDAKAAVLERLDDPDNAVFVEFELDDDDRDGDDTPEYEGKVVDGTKLYEFEVNALTGDIDEWELEDDDYDATAHADLISEDEAKEVVLGRLDDPDNAEFLEFELDDTDDDGDDTPEYEGKVRDGDDVYEFEVNAITGDITDWDLEDDD